MTEGAARPRAVIIRAGIGGLAAAAGLSAAGWDVTAVGQEIGLRRPDGRWLVRSSTEHMITDRFGDPVILLPRSRLIEAAARMTTWTSPPAIALRDGLAMTLGKLAPAAALRGLTAIYDWRPPAPVTPRS